MIELTLREIADITGGRLAGGADADAVVTGSVEFDSRKITPGGLFLALPGARVDGHDFAAKAIEQGAVAVLGAREVGVPSIVVEPTGRVEGDGANADIYANDSDGSAAAVVRALSDLARAVTQRLHAERGLTIVGITGSAGKTSTKDLVATVLRAAAPDDTGVVAPPGSFNNEIGHPYTALRCGESTRYLVAEMSARGIGHIAHLADIAAPSIGVVLNVGSAHLGEFGSRENIAVAKGELVEALPPADEGGVAILNADDDLVAAMAARTAARVVTTSAPPPPAPGAGYVATDIELDDVARPTFTLHAPGAEPVRVKLQVFGKHQVSNALAAVAAAQAVGMDIPTIAHALQGHTNASAHRMDVQTRADGLTIIDDSYNANPDSMRAAIAALGYTTSARPGARAIAVLGEMGELGADALVAHESIADDLAKYRIGYLVVVGDSANCNAMARAAAAQGITTTVVAHADEAIAVVNDIVRTVPADAGPAQDVVLAKASNAQALWHVVEGLRAQH